MFSEDYANLLNGFSSPKKTIVSMLSGPPCIAQLRVVEQNAIERDKGKASQSYQVFKRKDMIETAVPLAFSSTWLRTSARQRTVMMECYRLTMQRQSIPSRLS